MRCVAAPRDGGHLVTADIESAREAIAGADFFGRAFGVEAADQRELHREAAARLMAEVAGWEDEPSASDQWR